ncbi:3-isopropylmalate dehydratase small subunit [Acidisphaera sp. L21]|uniref:3-isopropylmalate dehydratase small subunit n=1 Tax=Acidisphaera sp. L21 TaxID=1641851 RepID=UPI00131ECDD3|nr:3-isopropylmalate dehydratase small subunit [Acidisphaera sp. L21]
MQPFTILTAAAVPLPIAKIDTGMILPGRYMRRHRRPGHDYSEAFLHDVRFDENEQPRPECALNDAAYGTPQILLTDADFGCGSSREGAAYAVMDYGFRALIGPSFAEIFYGNCLQNGILLVTLDEAVIHQLWAAVRARPGSEITIDLPNQLVIDPAGARHSFDINPLRKERLILGQDDISVTESHGAEIVAFEAKRRMAFPWLPITSQA